MKAMCILLSLVGLVEVMSQVDLGYKVLSAAAEWVATQDWLLMGDFRT
jgi:hypothetical protein